MSSLKCSQCGLVNWADATTCKRCHTALDGAGHAGVFTPAHKPLDDMSYPSFSSYQPPQDNAIMQLAGRGARLAAVMVDGLCVTPLIVIAFASGILASQSGGRSDAGMGTIFLLVVVLYILGLALVQLYLLSAHGQTLGKKAMKIRIVKLRTGENGGFLTNIILRGLVPGLAGNVPLLGPLFSLVNVLFIFREDKRCIHDLIAGTCVIKA